MQDLVYKLVPGVFGKEMKRRRDFYAAHPEPGRLVNYYIYHDGEMTSVLSYCIISHYVLFCSSLLPTRVIAMSVAWYSLYGNTCT